MKKLAMLSAAIFAAGVAGAQANTPSLDAGNVAVSIERILANPSYTITPSNAYVLPTAVAQGNTIRLTVSGALIRGGNIKMCDTQGNTNASVASATGAPTSSVVNLRVFNPGGVGGSGRTYYFKYGSCGNQASYIGYTNISSNLNPGDRVTLTVAAYGSAGQELPNTRATSDVAIIQRQFRGEIVRVTSRISLTNLRSFVAQPGNPPMTTASATIAGFRIIDTFPNNNNLNYLSVNTTVVPNSCNATINITGLTNVPQFIFTLRGNFDVFSTFAITSNSNTSIGIQSAINPANTTQTFSRAGNTPIICKGNYGTDINGLKLRLRNNLNTNITPRNITTQIDMRIGARTLPLVNETISHEIVMDGTYAYVPLVRHQQGVSTFIKFISNDPAVGQADIQVEVVDRTTGQFRLVPGVTYNGSTRATAGREFTISSAEIVARAQAAGINIDPVQGFPVRIFIPARQSNIHIYANSIILDNNGNSQFRRIPVKFHSNDIIGAANGILE